MSGKKIRDFQTSLAIILFAGIFSQIIARVALNNVYQLSYKVSFFGYLTALLWIFVLIKTHP